MPSLDNDGFDSTKPMTLFLKTVSIQCGIMAVPYSGPDLRRWIDVDDDDEISVSENTEDPLAELLYDSLTDLSQEDIQVGNNLVDVNPAASVSVLARKTPESRALKARVWLAYDLRDDNANVVAVVTNEASPRAHARVLS